MENIKELYQQLILDHNRNPKNFKKLESANRQCEGFNPLCGDRVVVYLNVKDDVVEDISFEGSGCAISKASASIMTTLLKGKTITEVKSCFDGFREMATTGEQDFADLGKLVVLAGVHKFPSRVKCAMLAWHTMVNTLEKSDDIVSTEKSQ